MLCLNKHKDRSTTSDVFETYREGFLRKENSVKCKGFILVPVISGFSICRIKEPGKEIIV